MPESKYMNLMNRVDLYSYSSNVRVQCATTDYWRVSMTSGETEDEIIINSDQYIVIFVFRERSVQEARAVSNVRLLVTTYV